MKSAAVPLIAARDEIFQWPAHIVSIAAGNCAAAVLTAIRKSKQVAQAATASRRAASGNNDRLSTPWREVISLAGVARSISRGMVVPRLWVPRPTRAPRSFDSNFTTKPVGQGSDLGLGQVQRFVQERGDAVEIK